MLTLGAGALPARGLPFSHRYAVQLAQSNVLLSSVPPLFLEQAGVALLDFDRDGRLDVYLTNGPGFANGLLRNTPNGFVDVAEAAGVTYPGGTAAVSGDLDGDGWPELFVARRNANVLYRNRGDGTFADISGTSGIEGGLQLTVSATLCDVNNDGQLDLYLGNRRNFSDDALHPNQLFLNLGGMRFIQVGHAAGVDNPVTASRLLPGQGQTTSWAVACLDYDLDGDQDLAVAVDFSAVALLQNQWAQTGVLRFENATLDAGLGASGNWMGLAVGDFDGNGWPDLFVTNWGSSASAYRASFPTDTRHHALYLNRGNGTFAEVAADAGLADWPFGWGATALDWENDGDLDIYYAGNMVEDVARPVRDNPGHLFLNDGNGRFAESRPRYDLTNADAQGLYAVGHGVAAGDLDGNGFYDVIVANSAYRDTAQTVHPAQPIAFMNAPALHDAPGHWLKVVLVGTRSNRNGIGARLSVSAGGRVQQREVRSGNGHQGQDALILGFGLGQNQRADRIEVTWPSGQVDVLTDVDAGQPLIVVEGAHPQR